MSIRGTDSVESIVNESLEAAQILTGAGIDFCLDGDKSLEDACAAADLSLNRVLRMIRQAEHNHRPAVPDHERADIDELTRFIEAHHHVYICEKVLFIKENIARLVRLYGKKYPRLEDIYQSFVEMAAHLTVHMSHEENIVFPYIRRMVKRRRKAGSRRQKSASSPIPFIMDDHETEHRCLKRLDDLTDHYCAPEEKCCIFKVTYRALREFEYDLQRHIRLETEVLFPRALQMESTLTVDERPPFLT